jgi:hypothetical protein
MLIDRLRALRPPLRVMPALAAAWPRIRRQSGKSTARLIAEPIWLAAARGIPPFDYYLYGLFVDARRGDIDEYLYQDQIPPLVAGLERRQLLDVNDKARFAARASAGGLRVVATEAVFRAGALAEPGWNPPAADLFVKPVDGSHGRGAVAYTHTAGAWQRTGEPGLKAADLLASLAARSRGEPLLVQRRLRSCETVADLTSNGLITARVVTMLDETGRPEHLLSVLKLPLGGREIDNLGLACPIFEDGRIGRGLSYRFACDGFDVHPDTGAAITGRALPEWPAVRALALQAHRSFPEFFALGWDIALARGGPVLLEANAGWDTATIQRPHDRPLGRTRFAAMAAARLASGGR